MDVVALYIDENGIYPSLTDSYGVTKDARVYNGPWPIVAHPPCGQWGRLRAFCKANAAEKECAVRAVQQLREWGGVLEHPEGSSLWQTVGLPKPKHGQIVIVGKEMVLSVDQCDWGHPARKRTWLYVYGFKGNLTFPPKRQPTHSIRGNLPEMKKGDRHLTPPDFAIWLLSVANQCKGDLSWKQS